MNFGTYELTGDLDSPGKLVYSFKDYPAIESYRTYQDGGSIMYEGNSFRFSLGVDEHEWSDAGGNVALRAERLGPDGVVLGSPQDGYEHPTMERSTLGKATGTMNGDPVEGLYTVDLIYSRTDLTFGETMFTQKIRNYSMNWLVEYEDGELEGGFAWRGQPGSGFAAAHHYRDGGNVARSDARIEVERTEHGSMKELTLSLGKRRKRPIRTARVLRLADPHSGGRRRDVAGQANQKELELFGKFPLNWDSLRNTSWRTPTYTAAIRRCGDSLKVPALSTAGSFFTTGSIRAGRTSR